jgi:xanthine dehydrogenase accessory factor
MKPIFSEIIELLASGQPVALVRIIRQTGSTPRSTGTSCLVLKDGTIKGTIGGGSLEYQVIQKAVEVLKNQTSDLLEFRLTGREVAETQMICGGLVDVYLEPLDPENADTTKVFQQAHELLKAGRRGVLVTRIDIGTDGKETGQRALLTDDGSIVGGLMDQISGAAVSPAELLNSKRADLLTLEEEPRGQRLFVEPLKPDSVLFLFGAGHVSTFVAPLATLAGFRLVVIDDREEFANAARFPQADEIVVSPIDQAFEKVDINSAAYVAVITRGHIYDLEVLAEALRTPAAYIGMIGSLRKRNMIYRSLLETGFTPEDLSRVHSPIGLAIGAETPEEIAVSIVAELIHARALGPVAKAPFESTRPE